MEPFGEKRSPEMDFEVRSNGSQVFSEPYSEAAIHRLKNLVLTFYEQGKRKYYSISVDGEVVVEKNCDGRKFDNYLRFVTPHTRLIEVRMYQGASPNCNKHQFFNNRGLGSAPSAEDVNAKIERAIEAERMQNRLEKLSDQVQQLQKHLDDKTEEADELQELVDELKQKERNLQNLKELVTGGLQLFGGVFGRGEKKQLGGTPETPVEVTVQPQAQPVAQQPEASEGQEIFNELIASYGKDKVKSVLTWMALLAENPDIQEKIKVELQNKYKDGEA
ncbi:MAG: OmpH family outer membrane protein [Bacteroidetes bacterium]|nr:OmpH family outer membrane protein [Bacteroidota bacterium]